MNRLQCSAACIDLVEDQDQTGIFWVDTLLQEEVNWLVQVHARNNTRCPILAQIPVMVNYWHHLLEPDLVHYACTRLNPSLVQEINSMLMT